MTTRRLRQEWYSVTCPRCKERPRVWFGKPQHRNARYFRPYCRECEREWKRSKWPEYKETAALWARGHHEQKNAQVRRYNATSKGKATKHAYYLKTKTKQLARQKARYRANPELFAQRVKSWRARNPEKIRALTRSNHARRKGAEGSFDADTIRRLFWFQFGRCAYCFEKLGQCFHVDHRVPVSRGGSNLPGNLCLACGRCNSRKNVQTESEFTNRELRSA